MGNLASNVVVFCLCRARDVENENYIDYDAHTALYAIILCDERESAYCAIRIGRLRNLDACLHEKVGHALTAILTLGRPVCRSSVDFNCLPRHSFSNETSGDILDPNCLSKQATKGERACFFLKGNTRFRQFFIRAFTVHCYLICFQIVIFLQLSICCRSFMHILRHMRLC